MLRQNIGRCGSDKKGSVNLPQRLVSSHLKCSAVSDAVTITRNLPTTVPSVVKLRTLAVSLKVNAAFEVSATGGVAPA